MSEFRTAAGILRLAMAREEEAAASYARMAERPEAAGLRPLLSELRDEEIDHRRRLEALAAGGAFPASIPAVDDLGLSDDLPEVGAGDVATFQDLLIFAAKKEAQAIALYDGLAARTADAGTRRLFEFLSAQEKTHKLRLESEYENRVLPEN